MSMRSGATINGRHFCETHSSGAVRYTRRFFIDGKLVTRATYQDEIARARKAEAAKAAEAAQ